MSTAATEQVIARNGRYCQIAFGLQRELVSLASWSALVRNESRIDHSDDNANVPRSRDSRPLEIGLSSSRISVSDNREINYREYQSYHHLRCERYCGSIRTATPFLLFQRPCDHQTSLARRCILPVPAATRCAGRQPCPCGKGDLAKCRLLRRSIHLQQAERTGLPLRHARRKKVVMISHGSQGIDSRMY